jgi:hypothetical protein
MKIETPNAGVVRFNESNVIVASGGPHLVLEQTLNTVAVSGFTNSVSKDGEVTFRGVTYKDAAPLNEALAAHGLAGLFQGYFQGYQMGSKFTTEDMFMFDSMSESLQVSNGIYAWDGNAFVHQ